MNPQTGASLEKKRLNADAFELERQLSDTARSLNPCELEIDLFCNGARVDASCDVAGDGRYVMRTRAGLGSGLEIVIPGGIKNVWVNVPVEEDFAQVSPYRLVRERKGYFLLDDRNGLRYAVLLPEQPQWYLRQTSSGTPMHKIGVLQGTYLGIFISNSCGFWHQSPSMNCRFCTTGLNVGVNELAAKSVEDVVEVVRAAKEESGVTFVHFNSGFHTGAEVLQAEDYVKAVKTRVGSLVGLQLLPTKDLARYDRLIDLGVDHFSFCYEFRDPAYFAQFAPGKHKFIGQEAFLKALEYTSRKLGKGTCSGEIIAGVEPLDQTLRAIDEITSLGAFPTVCIFRPTLGSDMENWPPPRFEEMLLVFQHLYESCRSNRIPLDLAPNLEVSLVVQPGDTRYLAPRDWPSRWYEFQNSGKRTIAKPYFWWKLRPHGRYQTQNAARVAAN